MNILLVVIAIAVVASLVYWFTSKKEKFTMSINRPKYTYNIPEATWDPADVLTAVLPTEKGKSPKLAVELGDYRRFNRI